MEQPIINKYTGEILQGARVNPNKYLFDDNEYITGYRQFINTVDKMLLERGITEYSIQRLDFRIDNYNNTFDELYKLNNIIINLLSMAMGIDNCYKSLKNDIPHNIVARSNRQEVECYNRIAKDENGLTKTRIELRRKFPHFQLISKIDIQNIYDEWKKCFYSKLMPIYYRQFQSMQNNRILQSYRQAQRTPHNIIDLISKNQDYICTSRQMNELCSMLNLAKDVAYTYKNRLHIEYYKYTDIERYIDSIITALKLFFTS